MRCGGGLSDRCGGPPQRAHLLGEVIRREEHGLAHDQLRGAHAAVARVDRCQRVHVRLLLEQRDRGADVVGVGGPEGEAFALAANLRHVRRWEVGARSRFARRSLDLGANVIVREGVGNAIVHHRVGR